MVRNGRKLYARTICQVNGVLIARIVACLPFVNYHDYITRKSDEISYAAIYVTVITMQPRQLFLIDSVSVASCTMHTRDTPLTRRSTEFAHDRVLFRLSADEYGSPEIFSRSIRTKISCQSPIEQQVTSLERICHERKNRTVT